MKLGSSAIPDTNLSFVDGYNKQIQDSHVKGCYYYGQSAPVWSPVAGIPTNHAIAYQTKGSDRPSYDSTLSTFPVTRPAYVFLHPINEIDRQVHKGVLSLAQAQKRCDDLYAAIAAAGKSYVIPSIGIQYWCLINYLQGNLGSEGEWNFPAYMRPGLKRILFSVYASGHVSNGHVVATAGENPYTMAENIDNQLDTLPGVTWTAVLGFPIPDAYINDPVSLQNRVKWLQDSFSAYTQMRHPATHMLWFDQYWPALGDERLAESTLHAKWLALAASVGQ